MTICNRNLFSSQFGFEYLSRFAESTNSSYILEQPDIETLREDVFLNKAIANVIRQEAKMQDRQNLSYSLRETLISCKYNYKSCTYEDFQWFFHPEKGNCYMFVKNVTKQSKANKVLKYSIKNFSKWLKFNLTNLQFIDKLVTMIF